MFYTGLLCLGAFYLGGIMTGYQAVQGDKFYMYLHTLQDSSDFRRGVWPAKPILELGSGNSV